MIKLKVLQVLCPDCLQFLDRQFDVVEGILEVGVQGEMLGEEVVGLDGRYVELLSYLGGSLHGSGEGRGLDEDVFRQVALLLKELFQEDTSLRGLLVALDQGQGRVHGVAVRLYRFNLVCSFAVPH